IVIITTLILAVLVGPVLADCTSTPNGSGFDYHCTETTTVINGSPNNDNVVNEGHIITYLWTGGFSSNSSQRDEQINTGIVGEGMNDDGMWGGAGNDMITNNGFVTGGPWTVWEGYNGAIFGDGSLGVSDDDVIVNNGTV